jgi:hypothetical protein
MQPGTEVYFFLNPATSKNSLRQVLFEEFSTDKMVRLDGDFDGYHEIFGRFNLERIGSEPGHVNRFCLMLKDCDLLPELAYIPPKSRKPEEAARFAYHFVRRLFLALDAESCWGTVPGDQVLPFDREDSRLGRIFKFTRSGPQKLVRPYEENRPIRSGAVGDSETDMGQDPISGEPRWVMSRDGPLATGSATGSVDPE